jgi:peroxiredoxin Q/BCP
VAGVSRDTVESNARWAERLRLPYPLLSDREGTAGRFFLVNRRLGIGAWSVELLRRCTVLVDAQGAVAAVWQRVHVRGHADAVLGVTRALGAIPPSPSPPPA